VTTAASHRDWAGLELLAARLRADVINMLHHAQAGHPGGSMSAVEILAALYFRVLRVDPGDPGWAGRDRFVLSKGHASAIYYAVLAERGFFPKSLLATYSEIDSCLQTHPDVQTPGVDASSGSLGQGLSVGVGMALAARLDAKDCRVYVLLGDGELEEGQVWEAAMAASRFQLSNLTAIIDYNKLQLTGRTNEVMTIEPLSKKWEAFNWRVIEVSGHDIRAIVKACHSAATITDKPTVIVAHTIKGKGVSFMEDDYRWHSAPISDENREQALAELAAAGDER
jgi:transketolase